eukprot:scaffold27642_cov30-Attheya_sp.AAC.1
MPGLHKRVGELRKQDEPLSIDVVHAAAHILEVEWARAKTKDQKKRIAEMGVWFVAGFCSGLRGEEMILIERAGTRINSLTHLEDPEPWFKFVVSGPTKGNQLSGSSEGCYPNHWNHIWNSLGTGKVGQAFGRHLDR